MRKWFRNPIYILYIYIQLQLRKVLRPGRFLLRFSLLPLLSAEDKVDFLCAPPHRDARFVTIAIHRLGSGSPTGSPTGSPITQGLVSEFPGKNLTVLIKFLSLANWCKLMSTVNINISLKMNTMTDPIPAWSEHYIGDTMRIINYKTNTYYILEILIYVFSTVSYLPTICTWPFAIAWMYWH